MKKLFIIMAFLLSFSALIAAEPYWDLAMVPNNGLITDIQISQNDIIYISSQNGVFSSTNNGNSWNWIFDGLTNTISLDKEDIIVSQGYSIGDEWRNLFISFDRGKAWKELIGPWSNILESYPTAHYFDNHILYILNITYSDYKPSQSMYQLYFTKDYGKSWDSTDNFKTFGTWNFEFELFRVKGKVIAIRAKNDTSSLGDLLYISRDLGNNWKLVKGQFSIINDIQIRDSLNFIIATNSGLYNTNDGGENWNLFAFSGIKFNKLLISNDNKTIISAYNKGLYYSLDTGKTWEKTKDTFDLISYSMIWALAQDSSSNFYVAPHYYGIYRTSDLSSNWEQINKGFSSSWASEIAFNSNNDAYMSSVGIFHATTDKWKEWTYFGFQKSIFQPIAFNKKNDIFIGATNYPDKFERGVYRSTDNGKSWEIFNEGLSTMVSIYNLIINKKGMLFCTQGAGGISRSRDNGETWEYMKDVHGTRLSINDEDHIFVFHGGTIFRSTDDGDSWMLIFHIDLNPISDDYSENIIFNHKTKTAFYGPVTYQTPGNENGNLKTTDNGRTWFKDSSNYDDSAIFNIRAVDSTYCWIGVLRYSYPYMEKYKRVGIYRSCDNGLNWQLFDTTGLKDHHFGAIGVSPEGYIYAMGKPGLYRSRDKFVSVEEKPKPNDDIIINPNPASDYIEVQNPNYEKVSILNILGETIFQTSEATKIVVSSLPTGIYLVRIGDKVSKFVKL